MGFNPLQGLWLLESLNKKETVLYEMKNGFFF